MKELKQIIVIRTDLRNTEGHKIRTGKLIAQGAHAAMLFLLNKKANDIKISSWISDGMTKICVGVDSEDKLIEIFEDAKKANLIVELVTDKGLTEFGGVPTKTCLAIGPDDADEINKITGHLKLL